jgi:hypothetical protein
LSNLITQIGGKFSRHNLGLFDLKQQLIRAGIKVTYPTGNGIVQTFNGIDLSFDLESSSLSFYQIEVEYLKAIRSSSFHTVYNVFQNEKGYVGRSTGMEIGYAVLHSVPIVFLYTPVFQKSISQPVIELLDSRSNSFNVVRLDCLSEEELLEKLKCISQAHKTYDLSVEEEITVMTYVQEVLSEY